MQTKDCKNVTITKRAKKHLLAHPDVWEVLEEALNKIKTRDEDFVIREVDLGRIIGRSGAVFLPKSDINEPVLFAKRIGRDIWSRVAPEGMQGDPVSTTVILLKKLNEQEYELITAYIGTRSPMEPTDPKLTIGELPEALDFWRGYALVYDKKLFGPIHKMTWMEAILNIEK